MRTLLVLISFLAQPALAADQPISPAEFEALVMGKTLSYASPAGEYGAEEYLEDRRVRWSYLDGDCIDGRWYEAGDQVCFVYDGVEFPQCWQFYLRADKLIAQFKNDERAQQMFETQRRDEPLLCLGPDVGV